MALESQPLSNEQMRRTWAMVDVLTSLKRRTNQAPPTADFIRRKFEALSIPATETLSILMALTLRKENCPLAHFHVYGMAHAVGSFPKETASEVAHVLACDQIVSAAALKTASLEASHVDTAKGGFVVDPFDPARTCPPYDTFKVLPVM